MCSPKIGDYRVEVRSRAIGTSKPGVLREFHLFTGEYLEAASLFWRVADDTPRRHVVRLRKVNDGLPGGVLLKA